MRIQDGNTTAVKRDTVQRLLQHTRQLDLRLYNLTKHFSRDRPRRGTLVFRLYRSPRARCLTAVTPGHPTTEHTVGGLCAIHLPLNSPTWDVLESALVETGAEESAQVKLQPTHVHDDTSSNHMAREPPSSTRGRDPLSGRPEKTSKPAGLPVAVSGK